MADRRALLFVRILVRVAAAFETVAALAVRHQRINAGIIAVFPSAAHHVIAVVRAIGDNVFRHVRLTQAFFRIAFLFAQAAVGIRIFIILETAAAGTVFFADKADFGRSRRRTQQAQARGQKPQSHGFIQYFHDLSPLSIIFRSGDVKYCTIDSYIIFPRCPLIFRLDFRRILTYLFLLPTKNKIFKGGKHIDFCGKKRYLFL